MLGMQECQLMSAIGLYLEPAILHFHIRINALVLSGNLCHVLLQLALHRPSVSQLFNGIRRKIEREQKSINFLKNIFVKFLFKNRGILVLKLSPIVHSVSLLIKIPIAPEVN